MATNNLNANRDTGMEPILGTLRARVEDNRDPLRLGRVRIRVPSMHGIPTYSNNNTDTTNTDTSNTKSSVKVDENSTNTASSADPDAKIDKDRDEKIQQPQFIETDDLPWAYPVSLSGGGCGHGGLIVPSVGDYVFVSFENGDRNSPIYFGGCFGIPKSPKYYGSVDPSDHKGNKSKMIYSSGTGMSEAPNVYDKNGNPTIKVLFASEKGSSIAINDSDGSEQISMEDNAQQGVVLYHPTNRTENKVMISSGPTQTISLIGKSDDKKCIQLCSGIYYEKDNKSMITLHDTDVLIQVGQSTSVLLTKDTATITSSNIVLNGNVTINGNLNISGNTHGSGDIIADGQNSNHHSH